MYLHEEIICRLDQDNKENWQEINTVNKKQIIKENIYAVLGFKDSPPTFKISGRLEKAIIW